MMPRCRKRSFLIAVLSLLPAVAAGVSASLSGCAPRDTHRVVATLPAVQSILGDLCSGTGIRVECAVPGNISLFELGQFIDEHGPLLDSLAGCDAVFDLRSVVPEDGFYPALRARNVRIVEVDCAVPADPAVSPVPLLDANGTANRFVWLSATNAMKMAEIAAKDLAKLFPRESGAIAANLRQCKKKYFALKSIYETEFSTLPRFEAATMTRDFDYFLRDINLFVPHSLVQDETTWGPAEKADFSALVKSGMIHTIVHRWKPSGETGALCDSAGVLVVVLDAGDGAGTSFKNGLHGLLENNFKALGTAFGR